MMGEPKTVHQAIAAAAAQMKAVPKDQRGQGISFQYRGIDGVMNAIHQIMSEHGVFIVPNVVAHEVQSVSTKSGGQRRLFTLTVRYDVYGPAGDMISGTVLAEGIDSGDKATGIALSYAFKVFAGQLFSLPTDDPEMDNEFRSEEIVAATPAQPVADPRSDLVAVIAGMSDLQRVELRHAFAADGWAAPKDIPAGQVGRAAATAALIANKTPAMATKAQLAKLGILGDQLVKAALVEDVAAYVSDHTGGRTDTRTELLKSEAGTLIEEWATLLPEES